METYTVDGGYCVEGEIFISGNKNGALPALACALLTDEKVVLHNIPHIADVHVMIDLIKHIGAKVKALAKGSIEIEARDIDWNDINLPVHLVDSIRASLLLIGPLLIRSHALLLPPPGGDVIGFRRIDTLLDALELFGARCHVSSDGYLEVKGKKLQARNIFLHEASVTTTENVIMIASMVKGVTVVRNAASEPHVQDVCRMLSLMGAHIQGIGSNVITIEGVENLGGCSFTVGPDYMEAGSFIGLAGTTHSELTLHNVNHNDLINIAHGFSRIGIEWKNIGPTSLLIPKDQKRIMNKTVSGYTNKIDDSPWPGFPADLLSIITVAATQMNGAILIHEKMYESRMFFIDWLIRMGANIILCDPHRALVEGPNMLKPAIVSSPDVRAGMALVIATLCAKGTSTIQNVYQIERGYESLVEKLIGVGAHIQRSR
jgi:UDP-N-acetylglucosamine 1-carboxyvinyltransferase